MAFWKPALFVNAVFTAQNRIDLNGCIHTNTMQSSKTSLAKHVLQCCELLVAAMKNSITHFHSKSIDLCYLH